MSGGPAQPPYPHPQSLGYPQANIPWSYSHELGLVLHPPDHCAICGSYSTHFMNALITRDPSLQEAKNDREKHYSQTAAGSTVTEMSAIIESLTAENTELKRQLAQNSRLGFAQPYQGQVRGQMPSMRGHRVVPYAGCDNAGRTRKVVDSVFMERISSPSVASSSMGSANVLVSLPGQLSPIPHQGEESIQITPWPERPKPPPEIITGELPDDMGDDDYEDNSHVAESASIPSSPWGARWIDAAKGGDFILIPSGNSEDKLFDTNVAPQTEAQIKFVDNTTNKYKSRPLARFLGNFKRDAQNTNKHARSPAQAWMCAHWKKKDWMDGKVFNPRTKEYDVTDAVTARTKLKEYKTRVKQANTKPSARNEEITFLTAERLGLVNGKEIHQQFGDPAKPRVTFHPEVWKLWYECFREPDDVVPLAFQHPGRGVLPKGDTVPYDYIRTHLRFTPILNFWGIKNDDSVRDVVNQIYYKAMLLLAAQGAYEAKVDECKLVIETYARYTNPPDRFKTGSVSREDIAAHFANCGVTVIEADDAQYYARSWLNVAAHQGVLKEQEAYYARSLIKNLPPKEDLVRVLDNVPYVWEEQLRRWTPRSHDLRRLERARRPKSSRSP